MRVIVFPLKSGGKKRKAYQDPLRRLALLGTTLVVCLERIVDASNGEMKPNSEFSDELHIELSLQVALTIGINAIRSRYKTPSHSEDQRATETNACTHPSTSKFSLSRPSSPPPALNHPLSS